MAIFLTYFFLGLTGPKMNFLWFGIDFRENDYSLRRKQVHLTSCIPRELLFHQLSQRVSLIGSREGKCNLIMNVQYHKTLYYKVLSF